MSVDNSCFSRQKSGQGGDVGEDVVGADAVSYTHLDVYKRQAASLLGEARKDPGGHATAPRHSTEPPRQQLLKRSCRRCPRAQQGCQRAWSIVMLVNRQAIET